MRRIVMAGAAVVLCLLASCTPATDDPQPQAPPTTPEAAPTQTGSSAPGPGTVDTSVTDVGGMNIRYLGEDGKTRSLDVKHFRR